MGQTASNVAGKVTNWYKGSLPGESPKEDGRGDCPAAPPLRLAGRPLVLRRTNSMYMDEDGDLAHEFYEQKKVRVSSSKRRRFKWVMVKNTNILPAGLVPYEYPRLNKNLPLVLCDRASLPSGLL